MKNGHDCCATIAGEEARVRTGLKWRTAQVRPWGRIGLQLDSTILDDGHVVECD